MDKLYFDKTNKKHLPKILMNYRIQINKLYYNLFIVGKHFFFNARFIQVLVLIDSSAIQIIYFAMHFILFHRRL